MVLAVVYGYGKELQRFQVITNDIRREVFAWLDGNISLSVECDILCRFRVDIACFFRVSYEYRLDFNRLLAVHIREFQLELCSSF